MLRDMATAPETTLLILGAGGDLTHRLLLPGLASLLAVEPERAVRVVGADRVDISAADWKARVKDSFAAAKPAARVTAAITKHTAYIRTDLLDKGALRALVEGCGDGPLVIFFALPPQVTMKVCDLLQHVDLPDTTRLALEKPFGTDHASAVAFNALLHKVVAEEDVFRIDHFLGVATVFNLVGLRFANRMLAPIWSAEHIERVEIVYDEDLALEGRAGYYDGAGALKDMLQSHLLQVLALFAMESIATLDARELQDQKAQVLRATKVWGGSPKRSSRRARYTAGTIGRRKVPDYAKEQGVDPKRSTETLAQVTLEVANSRWAGVPFVVRSGKALGAPRKQIVAQLPRRSAPADRLRRRVRRRPAHHRPQAGRCLPHPDDECRGRPRRPGTEDPHGQVGRSAHAALRRGAGADLRRQPAAHRAGRRRRGVLAGDGAGAQGLGRRAGAVGDVCRRHRRPRGLARALARRVRRGYAPCRARGRRSGRGRGAGSRRRTSRRSPSCGRSCG